MTQMGLSNMAIQILVFDMVFSGMLAFYDASFGGPGNTIAGIIGEITKGPPHVSFSGSLLALTGIAQFLEWFLFNIGLMILLLFIIVPLTAVPGVPFANFLFTSFQIILAIWFWTLVKPSGGTPS